LNGSDVGPMLLGSRLCGLESFIQCCKLGCFLASTFYLEATKAVWQAIQGNWGQVQPLALELVVFGSTTALRFFTIDSVGADGLGTERRMSGI
jgi:hypothetical protein